MQFYRHADGSVTVDRFDDEITLTFDLMREADKRFLRMSPDFTSLYLLDVEYVRVSVDYGACTATFWRVR